MWLFIVRNFIQDKSKNLKTVPNIKVINDFIYNKRLTLPKNFQLFECWLIKKCSTISH